MTQHLATQNTVFVESAVKGKILVFQEGLSFWGGVDPDTGVIIDAHHPDHGASVSGKVVLMPTSRGSCSGSGVLLQLARNAMAPAALVFRDAEDILTLGAVIASLLFNSRVAVLRLVPSIYEALSRADVAEITIDKLKFCDRSVSLLQPNKEALKLSSKDQKLLSGEDGPARKIAMEVLCLIAAAQGAHELIDVSQAHIDGCILAHDANLDFAEKMQNMGAKTSIPTTINAISVDRKNWQNQGVAPIFGNKASRLADAYVNMGARPTFTCAPYLLDDAPIHGEAIGWSESNAVIFANSVLGARTQKHPDYLDLFIAMTGRAPNTGVYLAKNRVPVCELRVDVPDQFDDALWPMLGWLAGIKSPIGIPLLTGLEGLELSQDDLKALCASFGTTSAAPMLHVRGHTPEGDLLLPEQAAIFDITLIDFVELWKTFNSTNDKIDLVAIGSPHASFAECKKFSEFFIDRNCHPDTETIVTVGRTIYTELMNEGILDLFQQAGVKVVSDICWCSITEPIFPINAKVLITNSGKYAHYGKGLTGRDVRFGSLEDCARSALSGYAGIDLPSWLKKQKMVS